MTLNADEMPQLLILFSIRAFNNGFLIAEVFSRYFPQEIQMHSFDNAESYAKKKDNW